MKKAFKQDKTQYVKGRKSLRKVQVLSPVKRFHCFNHFAKNPILATLPILLFFIYMLLFPMALKADWFGYFESETDALQSKSSEYLFGYHKLRLDFQAQPESNLKISANLIAKKYWGRRTMSLSDFLPDNILGPLLRSSVYLHDEALSFTMADTIYLDNFYLDAYAGQFHITLGRQQISPGVGYAWNPTDIFNRKDPMDPTYEQSGVDAIALELPLGAYLTLSTILQPKESWEATTRYGKGKFSFSAFDFSLVYGHFQRSFSHLEWPLIFMGMTESVQSRELLGFSFFTDLAGLGFWLEGARYYNRLAGYQFFDYSGNNRLYEDPFLANDGHYWQLLIGADYTSNSSLYILAEYFYNGFGSKKDQVNFNHYLDYLDSKTLTLNQNYLFLSLLYPWGDSVTAGFFTLANLDDQSFLLNPQFIFQYGNNLELSLMLSAGFGDAESEMGLQKYGGRLRLRAWF
jgi:hypothetical protein